MGQRLFHMVPAAAWTACLEYQQDGFIHLTADPALLLPVANHFYTSSRGDWLVLVLDAGKLTAEVKFEPAAPVGDRSSSGLLSKGQHEEDGSQEQQQGQQQQGQQQPGQQQQGQQQQGEGAPKEPLFPHLYGTIDFAAVVDELPMQRSADGRFTGIVGVAAANCPYSEFT
ncbi:hypothetical protein ABPG77_002282 [Micractinium sp. CCAP 211/92]